MPGYAGEHSGGVQNDGTLLLTDVAVQNCASGRGADYYDASGDSDYGGDGGGIFSGSAISLEECVFRGNTTADGGAGLRTPPGPRKGYRGDGGGLAIFSTNQAWTVTRCEVSDNEAGDGGGLYLGFTGSAIPVIDTCTFSGNHADSNGGGISVYYPATLDLLNCTVAENSAVGLGGGLELMDDCTVRISGTIIGKNASGFGISQDIQVGTGCTLTSLDYNLVEGDAGLFTVQPHDIVGVDPLLGAPGRQRWFLPDSWITGRQPGP